MKFKTIKELVDRGRTAIGKSFKQLILDEEGSVAIENTNKGMLGQIVEVYLFGKELDNKSEADFNELGVELKTTGYKINANGTISAKERLVLSMIDYMQLGEFEGDFTDSDVYNKCKNMLLVWYQYDNNPKSGEQDYKLDFIIKDVFLYTIQKGDLPTLKEDFNTIVNRVKNGEAHLISGSDTFLLEACRKGAGGEKDLRKQPFSDELAKQRAFAFKQSYLTSILRDYDRNEILEELDRKEDEGLKSFIERKVNPYIGLTEDELIKKLQINAKKNEKGKYPKNINRMIIDKLLGVNNSKKVSEFVRFGIKAKTMTVNKNFIVQENVKLLEFNFQELIDTPFEESRFYDYIYELKYLFFVFQKIGDEKIFLGTKLWQLDENEIEKAKKVYYKTREVVIEGNIVESVTINKKGQEIRNTNLPKASDKLLFHVRPSHYAGRAKLKLPTMDKVTKVQEYETQAFWINKNAFQEVGDYFRNKKN